MQIKHLVEKGNTASLVTGFSKQVLLKSRHCKKGIIAPKVIYLSQKSDHSSTKVIIYHQLVKFAPEPVIYSKI